MRARLLLAALLSCSAFAEEFEPSAEMVAFAKQAIELQENDRIDEALALARRAEVCDGAAAELHCREYALFVTGYVQEREGNLDAALEAYRTAVQTFDAASLWANIGTVYTMREQYFAALDAFARANVHGECNDECALAYGQALERTGRVGEALDSYRRADRALESLDSARRLLDLLSILACRERRVSDADEILGLARRISDQDPTRARTAAECVLAAAGPDHPAAGRAAVLWLELAREADDEMIFATLPPHATAELRLLLRGGTGAEVARWWTASTDRRAAAARFLLSRARRAGGEERIALAERAYAIAPPVAADSVRTEAAVELLYRHATALDDRKDMIDGLAAQMLDELLGGTGERCALCFAQIAVIAASSHLQRDRPREAEKYLLQAWKVTSIWGDAQPHVNVLLAEVYGALHEPEAQADQLRIAAAAYRAEGSLAVARELEPPRFLNEDAVQETVILTRGYPAEYGQVSSSPAAAPVRSISPIAIAGRTGIPTGEIFRGGNWRGSAEFQFSSGSEVDPSSTTYRGGRRAELTYGGPLVTRRLWAFGSYGTTDVRTSAVGGSPNETEERRAQLRLTFAPTPRTWLAVNGWRVTEDERNAGASPSRALSAQHDAERLRSSLALLGHREIRRGLLAEVTLQRTRQIWENDARSSVAPRLNEQGIWFDNINTRDDETADRVAVDMRGVGDAEDIRATISGIAEIRRWDDTTDRSSGLDLLSIAAPNILQKPLIVSPGGVGADVEEYWRSGESATSRTAMTLWLSHDVSFGNKELEAQVRYTGSRGNAGAVRVAANRARPGLLPAVSAPAADPVEWSAFAWSLRGYRSGLVSMQASASRIPSALTSRMLSFGQLDAHDFVRLKSSVRNPAVGSGIDPRRPEVTSNIIDPHLRPEMTDAVKLQLWYASVTLTGELSRTRDVMELRPLLRDTGGIIRPALASDYVLDDSDGPPVYAVPRATGTFTGGALLTNGDRERRLASATLRLKDSWRGIYVTALGTVRRRRWHIGPEYRRFDDPTETLQAMNAAGLIDGDVEEEVAEASDGSDERALTYGSWRWMASTHASYSFALDRLEIQTAAQYEVREGNVRPAYATVLAGDGRLLRVRDAGATARYPDRHDLAAHVYMQQKIGRQTAWARLEGLNLLDRRTDLRRIHDLASPRAGLLEETRLGRAYLVSFGLEW